MTSLRNSPFNQQETHRWNWRDRIFPALNDYPALLERHIRAETLLPRAVQAKRADIGFVVPFGSYGGAEKVAYAAAMELRKNGFNTHLFVIGGNNYKVISEYAGAFGSIVLVGTDIPAIWGGSKQGRGTEFATSDDEGARPRFVAGPACDHGRRGQLSVGAVERRDWRSPSAWNHDDFLHSSVRSQMLEREVGHPFLGLLFEHAYDLFVLCSHRLRHRLHALGMPSRKNADCRKRAKFHNSPAALAEIRARRLRPCENAEGPLYRTEWTPRRGLNASWGSSRRLATPDSNFISLRRLNSGRGRFPGTYPRRSSSIQRHFRTADFFLGQTRRRLRGGRRHDLAVAMGGRAAASFLKRNWRAAFPSRRMSAPWRN